MTHILGYAFMAIQTLAIVALIVNAEVQRAKWRKEER